MVHRVSQLLLKGLSEVNEAAMPLEAAEMALLRLIHASDLPDPGALIEKLASGEAVAAAPVPPAPKEESQAPLLQAPASFAALVEMLAKSGKAHLAQQLHDYVGLVRYAPPELAVAALKSVSGSVWQVRVADEASEPSLLEQEKEEGDRLRQEVLDSPLVRAAFEAFPDAELAGYTIDERRNA